MIADVRTPINPENPIFVEKVKVDEEIWRVYVYEEFEDWDQKRLLCFDIIETCIETDANIQYNAWLKLYNAKDKNER